MATASPRSTTRSNGASRQIPSVRRRSGSAIATLLETLVSEGRALGHRAGQWLGSAARSTRQHPWTALSVVAAGAALVGGFLWARRR
jgi:ElaB/YqjD/DUF883 family membrane-anchored ribosome-binding protein